MKGRWFVCFCLSLTMQRAIVWKKERKECTRLILGERSFRSRKTRFVLFVSLKLKSFVPFFLPPFLSFFVCCSKSKQTRKQAQAVISWVCVVVPQGKQKSRLFVVVVVVVDRSCCCCEAPRGQWYFSHYWFLCRRRTVRLGLFWKKGKDPLGRLLPSHWQTQKYIRIFASIKRSILKSFLVNLFVPMMAHIMDMEMENEMGKSRKIQNLRW